MSLYRHLTLKDRELILVGVNLKQTLREMATLIGCSKATVSREIRRNGNYGNYSAVQAQENYQKRRLKSRRSRILSNSELQDFVVKKLVKLHWSPEQISGRLVHENSHWAISYNTIYRGIEHDNLGVPLKSHNARGLARKLRHRGKTRKIKGTVKERRGRFNDVSSIHERPISAENRSRFGHWEGDTVRGKTGRSALVTIVDRKSRFLLSQRVPKAGSQFVFQAILNLFAEVTPKRVRSFTPDRGSEFSKYHELMKELEIPVFFPDPHAPQQRGTNENTNGLIREYFPKGTDLDELSDIDIAKFVQELNNRPRKVLGWKTPAEAFLGQTLHLI